MLDHEVCLIRSTNDIWVDVISNSLKTTNFDREIDYFKFYLGFYSISVYYCPTPFTSVVSISEVFLPVVMGILLRVSIERLINLTLVLKLGHVIKTVRFLRLGPRPRSLELYIGLTG